MRVILADADASLTEVYDHACGLQGLQIERVATLRSALRAVIEDRPQLLAVGERLGDGTGLRLLERLSRRLRRLPPTLYVTKGVLTLDRFRALRDCGVHGLVQSPVSAERICEQLGLLAEQAHPTAQHSDMFAMREDWERQRALDVEQQWMHVERASARGFEQALTPLDNARRLCESISREALSRGSYGLARTATDLAAGIRGDESPQQLSPRAWQLRDELDAAQRSASHSAAQSRIRRAWLLVSADPRLCTQVRREFTQRGMQLAIACDSRQLGFALQRHRPAGVMVDTDMEPGRLDDVRQRLDGALAEGTPVVQLQGVGEPLLRSAREQGAGWTLGRQASLIEAVDRLGGQATAVEPAFAGA